MPSDAPDTTAALLAAVLAGDPGRPLFTQYDDATGERVELSATTVENWVSKTANLVREAGAEPGDAAAVLLPAHWQAAVIMLGCWSAGVAVAHGGRGGAGPPAKVAFCAPDGFEAALGLGADEVYALSLAPFALPLPAVPAGVLDFATEVRSQDDRFTPYSPVGPGSAALVGAFGPGGELGTVSQSALVDAARVRAAELGLTAGDRLLVLASDGARPRPLDWLLAPLAAGASVVLVRNPDPTTVDARATAERVTARLP